MAAAPVKEAMQGERSARSLPLRSLRERQLGLIVMCVGLLVAFVDGSAVYVALPTIQHSLGFSSSNLAWVVNAYLIPFGGLLLFAGRLGDLIGPKRVFIGGLCLFTAASVACGVADSQAMLIAARFFQGAGGALSSAVVLGMIVTIFPKPREQAQALGFYGFVGAAAAAIGLLTGAVLTQLLSWHWIFFVNVPIGLVTLVFAVRLIDDVRDGKQPRGSDPFGTVTLVAGLMLAVYTIVNAEAHGWATTRTLVLGAVTVALLIVFSVWQTRASSPLVPPSVIRARNVLGCNVVLALMSAGPAGMFFLGALYLRNVLGFTTLQLGVAMLPASVTVAVGSLRVSPRLLRKADAKTVLVPSLLLMTLAMILFTRIPAAGNYTRDLLPGILLMGFGAGLGTPAVLRVALADATTRDSGVRSGLVNTTQQIGGAIGLAILAPVAATATSRAAGRHQVDAIALTHGYRIAFVVGVGLMLAAILIATALVSRAVPKTAPDVLDSSLGAGDGRRKLPPPTPDPDFLALGLGASNMMSVLWSIAMGRRAVAVDLRGDPFLGTSQWSISEDLYHHLFLIDRLMVERYGEDRIPRRGDGSLFWLHECFYAPGADKGADALADEVVSGWSSDAYVAGPVELTEIVDDRWRDGKPHRHVTRSQPVSPTAEFNPGMVGRSIKNILGEPFAFQVGAEELLILLRRYLEEMQRMDLAEDRVPRIRICFYHRVVKPTQRRGLPGLAQRWGRHVPEPDGLKVGPDGRVRVRIEAVRELDEKGTYRRVREPDSETIDLGVPELVVIAEGLDSADARRLGFTQQTVRIDHEDGRGPVPAEADYIVAVMGVFLDSRLRRRVVSVFDKKGNEYWIRQMGIGHESFTDIAWLVTEVPDFKTFDPVQIGMVPRGTSPRSREYYGAYRYLVRDFHLEQVSLFTGIPKDKLEKTLSVYGARLVTVTERIGDDALLAANVVVAGDSFGNGHFLATGGSTTGMVGHPPRVHRFWQDRDAGVPVAEAIRILADGVRQDVQECIEASEVDFAQPPVPAECWAATARLEPTLAKTRRHRRSIAPVIYRDDWDRLHTFAGNLWTTRPELLTPDVATMGAMPMDDAMTLNGARPMDDAVSGDRVMPVEGEKSANEAMSGDGVRSG